MGWKQEVLRTGRRRLARLQPTPGRVQAAGSGPEPREPAESGCYFHDPVRRVRASRCWLRRALL